MYTPLLRTLDAPHVAERASAANAGSAASSPSSSTDLSTSLNNMFLQLLTAQLKAQSPIDPLDPNQFVGQLAQFQSLSELTQIDQGIQVLVASVITPTRAGSQAATSKTSNAIPTLNFLNR